jgi:hypothetical protein
MAQTRWQLFRFVRKGQESASFAERPNSRSLNLDGKNPQMAQTGWRSSDSLAADIEAFTCTTLRIPFVRLVRFSFLILIGRFGTLYAWSVKASHPCTHLMIMGNPVRLAVD